MKRYISIGLCMLFAFNLSAQKALIIHKTDGTRIEIPVEETPRLYTTGKAVVHDNDYVHNHNVEVDIPHTYPEKPNHVAWVSLYIMRTLFTKATIHRNEVT